MEAVSEFFLNVFLALIITGLIISGSILVGFILRYLYKLQFTNNLIKKNTEGKDLVYLVVKLPPQNDKKEDVMTHFLNSIHRVLGQGTHISMEITSMSNFLYFYIVLPQRYKDLVMSQLYAQYPDIEVEPTSDYWTRSDGKIAVAEFKFKKNSMRPLKTYEDMNENLLRNVTAFMTTIQPDEQIFIQLVLKRVGSKVWQRGFGGIVYEMFGAKYSKTQEATPAYSKANKKLYRGVLRVAFKSKTDEQALSRLKTVSAFFKQYKSTTNELKFAVKPTLLVDNSKLSLMVQARTCLGGDLWMPEEIATFYHFPYHASDVSHTAQTQSKKAPAPDTVPREGRVDEKNVTFLGKTNFRNEKVTFGIMREDRRRHMYIVGKTGSGKSRLLELLMMSDIKNNHGVCLIDPHGDLAEKVLLHVPKNRVKDVVYVNPSDRDFPMPFNPLEYTKDFEKRQHIAHFFISIFKKIFSGDWNERMEHILRFIILALLETPDSNILGIPRLLSDIKYRQHVVSNLQDPAVKSFWTNEFSAWNEQYSAQAIVPILNKVGQFISNPIIRNMVGQQKNVLDFSKFMNEGKIVIINLSKGKLGEDNAALLGSMFITKIQQAALSRASIEEEKRRDFYFYIDEFQNFATDAFNSILSESRKYRLNLTIAHQYTDQLSDDIKSSVFGNVGSLVIFSVGGNDAAYLAKEFSPTFTADDMINLEAREMYLKLSVNGRLVKPFSGRTLTTPEPQFNYVGEIRGNSQRQYAQLRVVVEREIDRWMKSKGTQNLEGTGNEEDPEPII